MASDSVESPDIGNIRPDEFLREQAAPPQQQEEKQVRREPEWREVISWEGKGVFNTESFDITSEYWRIRWSIEAAFGAVLQIFIYDKDDFLSLAVNTANVRQRTTGVSQLQHGGGRFHLRINSANARWKITVEQQEQ